MACHTACISGTVPVLMRGRAPAGLRLRHSFTKDISRCLTGVCPPRNNEVRPVSAIALETDVHAPAQKEFVDAGSANRGQHEAEAPAISGLISREEIRLLEAELDQGASMAALRRFNYNLRNLTADNWEGKVKRVMLQLAFNLESFNPAFTAILLKVQNTIGSSDYEARDAALKLLINPLAGEYGMCNGFPQGKTHRELFAEFYGDLMKEELREALREEGAAPPLSLHFFHQMQHDILTGGGFSDPLQQASYALGYNLAIEYLADYEKTWMLDSFRLLNKQVLEPQGRPLSHWEFLEVHAEGEAEHAAIGHGAAACFVPADQVACMRQAMQDHDRDFAAFYNALANMLQ